MRSLRSLVHQTASQTTLSRLPLPLSLSSSSCRHFFNDSSSSSVLGTSTLSTQFLRQMQEDLTAEEGKKQGISGFADLQRASIARELDHMESPEADAAHLAKLDKQVTSFFDRIPLPADPMKAALAPTRDEIVQQEKFEVLKETVRERYMATQSRRRVEEKRIHEAMKRVEDGTHPSFEKVNKYDALVEDETSTYGSRFVASSSSTSRGGVAAEGDPAAQQRAKEVSKAEEELAEMRRKVAALEAQLKAALESNK